MSGVGEAGNIGARLRKDQRTPPACLEDALLVSKIEKHLQIGFTALGKLVGRRDRSGDGFAVPEWLDYLDALLRCEPEHTDAENVQ